MATNVHHVVCVVQDGSRPISRRQLSHAISAVRGLPLTVTVEVRREDGRAFNLTGATLQMRVDGGIPLSASVVGDAGGTGTFAVPQRANVEKHFYTLSVVTPTGTFQLIPSSNIDFIDPQDTLPNDP